MSDGIYQKIRTAVGRVADASAHLNAANAAERIGKSLGLSDSLIQYTHVELRNSVFEPEFRRVPINQRMLFLPHCARNAKSCKAVMDEEGYKCKECGGCNIGEAIGIAKKLGYGQIFVVPGGSLVKKLIEKYKPKAAIGVCCFNEALMSFEIVKNLSVIPQIVLLLKDGCKDTKINLSLLEEKLNLVEKPAKEKKKK